MEIQGFIIRRGSTKSMERHWTGAGVRIYHVKPGPKLKDWYTPFKHRGKEYKLEYFDGCFHPFVVEVGKPVPSFV